MITPIGGRECDTPSPDITPIYATQSIVFVLYPHDITFFQEKCYPKAKDQPSQGLTIGFPDRLDQT